MFPQSYFALPVFQKYFTFFPPWASQNFTCLPILEGDIVQIKNYDYDKYFSISAWRKLGGTYDTKVKEKYQKKEKKVTLIYRLKLTYVFVKQV